MEVSKEEKFNHFELSNGILQFYLTSKGNV